MLYFWNNYIFVQLIKILYSCPNMMNAKSLAFLYMESASSCTYVREINTVVDSLCGCTIQIYFVKHQE